jgi:hypothetical protein
VTKDQLQHHLISVLPVPDSDLQAGPDSGHLLAVPADRVDPARGARFSAAKSAVFVQKKIWSSTIKSLARFAFLLLNAAKLFLEEFQEIVRLISVTLLKLSSVQEILLFCRLQPITQ